jgi:hypothetical protein
MDPAFAMPRRGTEHVIDLGIPLVVAFHRNPRIRSCATRRIHFSLPVHVHKVLNLHAPDACRVEVNAERNEVKYFVNAVVHYPQGYPHNVHCCRFFAHERGWEFTLDSLLRTDVKYRMVLGWYPDSPQLCVRAMSLYDDGDAMMADIAERIRRLPPPQPAAGAGAVATLVASAGAGAVATLVAAGADVKPALLPRDERGRMYLRIAPSKNIAPPVEHDHGVPVILNHMSAGRRRWACAFSTVDGELIALMREEDELHVRFPDSVRKLKWTWETSSLLGQFLTQTPVPAPAPDAATVVDAATVAPATADATDVDATVPATVADAPAPVPATAPDATDVDAATVSAPALDAPATVAPATADATDVDATVPAPALDATDVDATVPATADATDVDATVAPAPALDATDVDAATIDATADAAPKTHSEMEHERRCRERAAAVRKRMNL